MAERTSKSPQRQSAAKSGQASATKQSATTNEQRAWEYLERKKIDKALVYFEGGGDDGYAYTIELVRGNKVVEEVDALVPLKRRDAKRPPIEWLLQEPIYEAFIFEGGRLFKDVITWVTETRQLQIPARRGRRKKDYRRSVR